MAVRVLIERRVLPGQEQRTVDLIRRFRARCLDEPGCIAGETLRDSEDTSVIIVLSTWFGLMDWRRWQSSPERRDLELQLRAHRAAPERVRVLLQGIGDGHHTP